MTNHSLLCLALTTATAAAAQPAGQRTLESKLDSVAKAASSGEAHYIGSFSLIYSRGYITGRPAYLYLTLRDAQRGRYVHRLRAGAYVYTNEWYSPRKPWLRVSRTTYFKDSHPDGDARLYYLHAAALRNRDGTVTSFALH